MVDLDLSSYKPLYIQTAYALVNEYRIAFNLFHTDISDTIALTNLHRISHSLKGQSAFMNYSQTALFFKQLEDFYSLLKNKPDLISLPLVQEIPQPDILSKMILHIEKKNTEYPIETELNKLKHIMESFKK